MRSTAAAVLFLVATCAATESAKTTTVDTGSFGIMVNGRRVATETFQMEQRENMNVVNSQLQLEDGTKASQTSEMEIAPDGSLRRYVWKETSPGKAQIQVTPEDNAFLNLKVTEKEGGEPSSTMHPLSAATPILDDNNFAQVEVLLWRYLASSCKPAATGVGNECRYVEQKMPVFNPHQRQSMIASFSYAGVQKMMYKGTQQEYQAFKFQTENGDWLLWADKQNKLVRILISAESTEILRD